MVNKKSNKDERFYSEINGTTFSSGWCSAPLIAILSIIVLIIGSLSIWYYVKPFGYEASQPTVPISFGGIKLPVSLNLGKTNKMSEEFRLRLTDTDLNLLLGSVDIPNSTDLSIQSHSKALEIHATVIAPIRAPLVLKIVPIVENGKIQIEVNDLTVGGIRALPLATVSVRQSIASGLQGAIDGQIKGEVTRIVLDEGIMNIYWKAN